MAFDQGNVVQAIVIGLPSIGISYLAYRQSKKVDAVAEQSGIVTETRAGTAQIIEALNQLIDNLQDDNRSFREDIKYLTLRLDAISKERDELKQKLNQMMRKYGENGDPPVGS